MLGQQQVMQGVIAKTIQRSPENIKTALKTVKKGLLGLVDLVYEYSILILAKAKPDVEDPLYLEQLCQSALEMHDTNTAETALAKLKSYYGVTLPLAKIKSRVIQLKKFYSEETPDSAQAYLQNVIHNDLSDPDAKKLYIHCKFSHDTDQYVEHLNLFLKSYPADLEAWQELGSIYTTTKNYNKAAFCYEELLVVNPSNTHAYVRLGELLFTQGGLANLRNAKDYLCFVVTKDKYNYRALWCLNRTCKALLAEKAQNLQGISDLLETSQALLLSFYKKRTSKVQINLSKFKF